MTPSPLEEIATASSRNQPASTIVVLPAEIDVYNREQAYSRLRFACASGASVVIADFTGTRFCDAGSMRRLLSVLHPATVQLRFAIRPGSPVRRIADLMDVDRCVPVYPRASLGPSTKDFTPGTYVEVQQATIRNLRPVMGTLLPGAVAANVVVLALSRSQRRSPAFALTLGGLVTQLAADRAPESGGRHGAT